MKNLKSLFVLLAVLITGAVNNVSAQNAENPNKIFIGAKGGAYMHDGTTLEYIGKDDILKNSNGLNVYFTDKKGLITDAKGEKVGKPQKNGIVYNTEWVSVLAKDKWAETCEMLDPKGHSGNIHKNYKLHACAAHCSALLKEKKKEAGQELQTTTSEVNLLP